MIVTDLRICDFRNLGLVHLEPNERFNILEGRNGQGKTNILEAIYVLGSLKSFRATVSREMIRFDCSQTDIRGVVSHAGNERVVRISIGERGRKVSIDGKSTRSLSDSLGQLTVVLFAPEDLALSKGSPSQRRRFIDRAVFNRWPASWGDMKRYEAALKQRNALLKQDASDDMLDAFDDQLAQAGGQVLEWRQKYLDLFAPLFTESLLEMSGGELDGRISYDSKLEQLDAPGLMKAFQQNRYKDRARRATSVGPHIDDLMTTFNGQSTRSYASQGQHRAFVLAMKIAEIRLLKEGLGQSPVLLLDDVSSELDAERNAQLMEYLCSDAFGGQVFLTTTDRSYVRIDSENSCFKICNGEIV
ncbi:MAG TPA: DNA replication/repair protein RecF [Myxococcales bacterium]|nr:DNA replication/repair protein RecF [Myxococcales bacterium]